MAQNAESQETETRFGALSPSLLIAVFEECRVCRSYLPGLLGLVSVLLSAGLQWMVEVE